MNNLLSIENYLISCQEMKTYGSLGLKEMILKIAQSLISKIESI
jgi:hypothetical protein